jgi:hypothetical protein
MLPQFFGGLPAFLPGAAFFRRFNAARTTRVLGLKERGKWKQAPRSCARL